MTPILNAQILFWYVSQAGIQCYECEHSIQARLVILTPLGPIASAWVSRVK
jgi:hypothetical protein